MKCPSCTNEIDEASASCPSCGVVFDELTAATRIMPERLKPSGGGGAGSASGRKGSGSDGARTLASPTSSPST